MSPNKSSESSTLNQGLIRNSDVISFQKLYKKYFGLDIEPSDARTEITMLVRLMKVTYQPITFDQLDAVLASNNGKKLVSNE